MRVNFIVNHAIISFQAYVEYIVIILFSLDIMTGTLL